MPDVADFAAIEDEFIRRAHTMVWCNVATVDGKGRPRSRLLHPIWEGRTGWIGTWRTSPKSRHLADNPNISLAYISDVAKPLYVEAVAAWVDDPETKQHVWDLFLTAPPPLGYDPASIFERVDHPNFGVLRLTPWRIALVQFPEPSIIWRAAPAAG